MAVKRKVVEETGRNGMSKKEEMSKIEAIRLLLAEQPGAKPRHAVREILNRFGVVVSSAHFSAVKSQLRAKSKEVTKKGPMLSDAREAQKMMKEMNGAMKKVWDNPEDARAWAEVVRRVTDCARACGGTENLLDALEFVGEVRGELR